MNLLENCPDVLTVMEAAHVLKVGRTTMYRLVQNGEVKYLKIGRKVLIPRLYLQDFIENNTEL
jgi:excisionase family DNA binding protein